jgi:hypothetical protein
MFFAFDVEAQMPPAALAQHFIVQRIIALRRRHVLEVEIAIPDGGERSDHHEIAAQPARYLIGVVEQRLERGARLTEHLAFELSRGAGQFYIEFGKLGDRTLIIEHLEEFGIHRMREIIVVENPGFDLEAQRIARV